MSATATSARVTPAGLPIRDDDVQRGLRINIVAGTCGIAWYTVAANFPMVMLLDCLKASGIVIGLVGMAMQITMLVQIPASLFAERLPARKRIWGWVTSLHRPLLAVPALLPLLFPSTNSALPWVILGIMLLSFAMAHAVAPLWFSWMADFVPERIRGRFYGIRQSVMMVANLLALAAAGQILDRFPDPRHDGGSFIGFVILFSVAAALGLADIIIHLWVPEPRPRPVKRGLGGWERICAPLREPDFRRLTLAMGAWFMFAGFGVQFGNLYLKRVFHVEYGHMSYIAIAGSLGAILASAVFGIWLDRIGARLFALCMVVLAPLTALPWLLIASDLEPLRLLGEWTNLPTPVAILMVTGPLAGALYVGIPLAQFALLGQFAPKEGRTMAMAVHMSLIGLSTATGSILGGVVVDCFPEPSTTVLLPWGGPLGFVHILLGLHLALAWFVALPLLHRVSRRPGERSLREHLPIILDRFGRLRT